MRSVAWNVGRVPIGAWTWLGSAFLVVQLVLAVRVMVRMVITGRGISIVKSDENISNCVTILVPVLNEEARLGPCLDALVVQGPAVREIIVIDGGSHDATRALALLAANGDARVRLIDAPAVPDGWNGKAWNLETGLRASDDASRFIVMIDADVRATPSLIAALVTHAQKTGLDAFSVAARQRLVDAPIGLVHPSMLASLVYRYGIPGSSTTSVARVQANGQCLLAARTLLLQTDAIGKARDSRCEDVTIARALIHSGAPVGFFEAPGLLRVLMYENWREAVRNWPRSLPMLDRYSGADGWIGLCEVLLVMALPPWIAAAVLIAGSPSPFDRAFLDVQAALIAIRLATLIGMRRAYESPPSTYWLSPLADVPVAVLLVVSALRRRHTWRGRLLVR